jgi:acyl carrier protein
LRFVGRNDLRVKIRGQRVDLGEIEDALRVHPGISDAAVNCFAEEEGIARLVAYIVCYPEVEPPTAGHLLDHLRGMLTEAALPARFITLDRLPRTTSGKVDRAELPRPERSAAPTPNASETVTSRVSEIFLRALEVTSLGYEDNFFDMGGNSLMAMRVVAAIRETFGIDLPMQSFFDDPSVQGISAAASEEILREIEQLSEQEARQKLEEEGDAE